MSSRALRAAVEVAEEHGLRFERRVVMRDRSNLLVRLEPLPAVARVPAVTAWVRHGDAWLAREVAVAVTSRARARRWSRRARCSRPGRTVATGWRSRSSSGWKRSTRRSTRARPGGGCASATRRWRTSRAKLPALGLLDEADAIFGQSGNEEVLEQGAGVRAAIEELGLPMQAVHGDAHLGNAINTEAGPLWNDWEDMLAPREWDLGCLHAGSGDPAAIASAQDGYGPVPESRVLAAFVAARRWQVAAWRRLY